MLALKNATTAIYPGNSSWPGRNQCKGSRQGFPRQKREHFVPGTQNKSLGLSAKRINGGMWPAVR